MKNYLWLCAPAHVFVCMCKCLCVCVNTQLKKKNAKEEKKYQIVMDYLNFWFGFCKV